MVSLLGEASLLGHLGLRKILRIVQVALLFLLEAVQVKGELDGVSGRPRPQVVLAGLEATLPGKDVRRRELAQRRLGEVNVQALRLANVRRPAACQLDQLLLRNLPNGFVDVFVFLWKTFDVLHRTLVRHQLVPGLRIPESELDQVLHKVRVDADELS